MGKGSPKARKVILTMSAVGIDLEVPEDASGMSESEINAEIITVANALKTVGDLLSTRYAAWRSAETARSRLYERNAQLNSAKRRLETKAKDVKLRGDFSAGTFTWQELLDLTAAPDGLALKGIAFYDVKSKRRVEVVASKLAGGYSNSALNTLGEVRACPLKQRATSVYFVATGAYMGGPNPDKDIERVVVTRSDFARLLVSHLQTRA